MHDIDPHQTSPPAGADDGATREPELQEAVRALFPGGTPNLYRAIGDHPGVLSALVAFKKGLDDGVLTREERCLVALEVAREADCDYCSTALGAHARHELGIGAAALSHAGSEALPDDPRHALVVRAARAVIESRGRIGRAEGGWFADQGLDRKAFLEIIAVVAEYTLATYAANLDRTRVDPDYRTG